MLVSPDHLTGEYRDEEPAAAARRLSGEFCGVRGGDARGLAKLMSQVGSAGRDCLQPAQQQSTMNRVLAVGDNPSPPPTEKHLQQQTDPTLSDGLRLRKPIWGPNSLKEEEKEDRSFFLQDHSPLWIFKTWSLYQKPVRCEASRRKVVTLKPNKLITFR